jgi:hypothetical protein
MIRDATGVMPTPSQAPIRPAQATPPAATDGGAAPRVPLLNPRMRIDPALNLVVLEFRGHDGELSRSIPSPREIDAYRSGEAEPARPALDVTR